MTGYTAPVDDMRFVLRHLAGLDELARLPGYGEATPDLVDAILEEAGKLAGEVLAPLNAPGDRQHARLENGVVRTPDGFRDAYTTYREGGWNGLPFDPDYGGMGLPWAVAFAVQEMWQAANMSFGLCPLLNEGAVELLQSHGTEAQKATYLPNLISGQWTGTMNLTEPQAGSDLASVRCRADRAADGSYRLHGQKVFITYGDHDLAENIIHMVLARLPDAPAGVRGVSLFLVPKFLVDADGALGRRNDVRCVSLEDKLGIRASPTCVMAFGDEEGAEGFLVGEENHGVAAMFTMMNNARLSVGLQGVAIAERAYQQARDYAAERIQGHAIGDAADEAYHPILHHPDVKRMVMDMRARTEAARALTYVAAAELDRAHKAETPEARAAAQTRVDLLTPVVKAWSTDLGVEVASSGIQVHGGMGYVEETGAAQLLRDARVAPIYEGTNGIQAADLVFRKVARDKGAAVAGLMDEMRATVAALPAAGPALDGVGDRLAAAIDALATATDWVVDHAKADAPAVATSAVPYLDLFGIVAGGHLMAEAGVAASRRLSETDGQADFLSRKLSTVRFYADHILSQAPARVAPVTDGAAVVLDCHEDWL